MQFDANRHPVEADQIRVLQARMLDAVMHLENSPHPWTIDELRHAVEDRLTAILGHALDHDQSPVSRALVDVTLRPDEAAQFRRVAEIVVEWGRSGQLGHWNWRHRFGRALMS